MFNTSDVEKVMGCSANPEKPANHLNPISQLKPFFQKKTSSHTHTSSSEKDSQESLAKRSEDQIDNEEKQLKLYEDEIKNLMLHVKFLEETKRQKEKKQELEAKMSKLLEKAQQLEDDIKMLDEGKTLKHQDFELKSSTVDKKSTSLSAINNPVGVKFELEEMKNSNRAVENIKANKLNWATVVKKSSSSTKNKGTSSTENKDTSSTENKDTSSIKARAPLLMELPHDVHKIIVESAEKGYKILPEFLEAFFESVAMKLELNSNVFAKFFPIYLNFRVFNQLFYLTMNNADNRERVLEYIKYFGPPKWAGLSALMDKYGVKCSFYMTEQVKENLAYTKMSPKDFKKFETYYERGWISFLDLTTGKVIPHDEVRPLFGKLLKK
jgi:hypothetical protein